MVSARAKKQDQKYLSKAEVAKGKVTVSEKKVAYALLENCLCDLKSQLQIVLGKKWVARLERSAKRQKIHTLIKLAELVE